MSPEEQTEVNSVLKEKVSVLQTELKLTHEQDGLLKPFRDLLGRKARLLQSGSAQMSPQVTNFLRAAFSCQIQEGYGLTETCAPCTFTNVKDWELNHVGGPLTVCELKIAAIPELDYRSSDPNPKGEVLMRGLNISPGYYKNEELTRESFVNGWFKSGDVGELLPNGTIRIIDRKKHIFKLAQGIYIAPERLEKAYVKSKYVSQIFVDGESVETYLVAIVVPDMS